MIATRAILVHRSVPRTMAAVKHPPIVTVVSRALTTSLDMKLKSHYKLHQQEQTTVPLVAPSSRFFSSIGGTVSDGMPTNHETTKKTPGHVTRTLRVLDMDVVRKIQEELHSVDVNSDGR
jgi:hypothetical protein